jgi:DNA-binding transcriptional ArsR family regulator
MLMINSNPYSEKHKLFAFLGDAIAHACRPFVIEILYKNGELSLSEINKIIRIPQSTLSRQVNHLARRGILKLRVEGTYSFYSLNNIPDFFIQFLMHNTDPMEYVLEDIGTYTNHPINLPIPDKKTIYWPSRIKGLVLVKKESYHKLESDDQEQFIVNSS